MESPLSPLSDRGKAQADMITTEVAINNITRVINGQKVVEKRVLVTDELDEFEVSRTSQLISSVEFNVSFSSQSNPHPDWFSGEAEDEDPSAPPAGKDCLDVSPHTRKI